MALEPSTRVRSTLLVSYEREAKGLLSHMINIAITGTFPLIFLFASSLYSNPPPLFRFTTPEIFWLLEFGGLVEQPSYLAPRRSAWEPQGVPS